MLSVDESLYENIKKTIKKDTKQEWLYMSITYIIMVAIIFLVIYLTNLPYKYTRWAIMCDYIITLDKTWTYKTRLNSNPSFDEILKIKWAENILFIKQLNCDWER